jgi:hypothetical protein
VALFFSFSETAPVETSIPISRTLRTQELVIIKIASAQLSVPESVIPVEISIAQPVYTTLPNDPVADKGSAPNARTAAVPTSVTRIVTINKLVQLFLLSTAPAASLS